MPEEAKLAPIEVIGGQGKTIGATTWVEQVVQTEKNARAEIHAKMQEGEAGMRNRVDELLIPKGTEITLKYELSEILYAPVKEGDCIGKISYMLGEEVLKECLLTAGRTVEKIDYRWCFRQVSNLLWL